MWHLTKLALLNRAVTLVIALLLAGGSIWALMGLKIEFIPNIEFPYVTVVTIYPEATPDTVVKDVSGPIEKVIWDEWSGHGLKHVTSTSSNGMSLIMGEFEYGTNMDKVTADIGAGIKQLTLPSSVNEFAKIMGGEGKNPQIIPININMLPLVNLSLSGNLPPDQLKQIADAQILPVLKDVEGVLRVDTEGGQKDQVIIAPDPQQMNKYGVSIAQIVGLLSPQYNSLDEIANTSLGTGNVKLSDVATVSRGAAPLSTITRTNGQPSVGISISKTEKANTVEVAGAIREKVNALRGKLGDGIQLTTVFDQSEYITTSINQLWEKAIVGGILAIGVVFLFLWAVRASLITAISIPLSVLIGFLGMRAAGLTINLITLSAMSIAVGRLIDDSIVMVEVIFRRRKQGEGFKDAALGGAKEVATPITSATLATVAIFIPLMFVGGIVGEMFIPFALTVTFAIVASLLVALLVVPTLSRLLVSRKSKIIQSQENWYQKIYVRALKWTLLHRVTVIVVALILFIGSIGLLPFVGTSFMAGMSDKMMTVNIRLPAGTDSSVTSATAARVEAVLSANEKIRNYYTSIGTGTSMQGIMSAASGGGSNTASIEIYLQSGADLKKETETLKKACLAIGNADTIKVTNSESDSSGGMGMGSTGLNVSVQGQSQEDVSKVASQLMAQLQGMNGLTNIASDLTTVVPKLTIVPDMNKLAAAGLKPAQYTQLQQEFYILMTGSTLPNITVNLDGESYPVNIKGIAQDLKDVQQAKLIRIGYPQSLALNDLASISMESTPSHISHTDTTLSVSVTASITEKNVGAVTRAVQQQIDKLPSHPGVEIKMAGIAEQMSETFSRMGIAIIIAIVIVFLVVILMMRSILNPLMIMVSLPLATIGAFMALAISRYTLSVSAMMGLLMLVGIVLTNAIVLVTLVEDLRRKGKSVQEALIDGGKTRLRPILMTALTTIFAMVPMAVGIGSGAMLTSELAVVVIGGLFSSTLLTLFVIPAIYSLVRNRKQENLAK